MVNVVRSPELEELARLGRRKFEEGDAAWFEQTTAHGEIASFGTAPGEESRGREDVLRLTIDEITEMDAAAGVDITRDQPADDFAVEAYEDGPERVAAPRPERVARARLAARLGRSLVAVDVMRAA